MISSLFRPFFDLHHTVVPQVCYGSSTMETTFNRHQRNDIRIIGTFTEVWCAGHGHQERAVIEQPGDLAPLRLCPACATFMAYAVARRLNCPLEAEKPSCKHCRIHCYAPQQRAQVKQIMAWSGRRLIMRGRLDYLWHYFF